MGAGRAQGVPAPGRRSRSCSSAARAFAGRPRVTGLVAVVPAERDGETPRAMLRRPCASCRRGRGRRAPPGLGAGGPEALLRDGFDGRRAGPRRRAPAGRRRADRGRGGGRAPERGAAVPRAGRGGHDQARAATGGCAETVDRADARRRRRRRRASAATLLRARLRPARSRDGVDVTDEAMAVERAGRAGGVRARLAAQPQDHDAGRPGLGGVDAARGRAARDALRVGTGFDAHRLVPGRPLMLGGVTVPYDARPGGPLRRRLPRCTRVCDALLGAAGAGDMGSHFPSGDARWKGAPSLRLPGGGGRHRGERRLRARERRR